MTRLERMKAAAANPPPAPIVAPVVTVAPATPAAKVKPPDGVNPDRIVVPTPRVEYRCGHTEPVAAFKAGDCPACRGQKRREKAATTAAKWNAERAARPAVDPFRLPAGSVKTLVWNGTAWNGTLTVPGCPDAFLHTADSEKRCYHGLHDLYVAWLRENGGGA